VSTVTFVQDPAGMHYTESLGLGEFYHTCALDANGQGTCVEVLSRTGTLSAQTLTYSGSLVPYYTLPAAATTHVVIAPWRVVLCGLALLLNVL
jgi:hypothetical protein